MLVEALVALSVLTVGFLGILTLLSRSTALTRVIGDNYTATYLAAEGIEIIKNLVDANIIQGTSWDNGFDKPWGFYEVQYNDQRLHRWQDRFLNFDPTAHIYGYESGPPTPFKRRVIVVFRNSDNEMLVASNVFWIGRGGSPSSIFVEDHFYNWRP